MSEELRGVDQFIEGQPPALESGDGTEHRLQLKCRTCGWRVVGPINDIFPLAALHAGTTGHIIVYRGRPQTFGRYAAGNALARAEQETDGPSTVLAFIERRQAERRTSDRRLAR